MNIVRYIYRWQAYILTSNFHLRAGRESFSCAYFYHKFHFQTRSKHHIYSCRFDSHLSNFLGIHNFCFVTFYQKILVFRFFDLKNLDFRSSLIFIFHCLGNHFFGQSVSSDFFTTYKKHNRKKIQQYSLSNVQSFTNR